MPASPPPHEDSTDDADDLGGRAVAQLHTISAALPAGEDRPQQDDMCRAVGRAIEHGRHLVVQAGTGTGKSLAYLVPATMSGRKVVVATATKALQDQLAGKDLPVVTNMLSAPVTFAVLKGRSNYLCRQRALEVSGRGLQQSLTDDGAARDLADTEGPETAPSTLATSEEEGGHQVPTGLVDQVQGILEWGQTTSSGDRAELPFEPQPRAWSMVSVGPRECPGAFRCPSGSTCFAEAAQARAAESDIVVVNTHLYGAHLASGGAVLPEHDVVIFDEAHELEEVMTASLGVEITPGRFRALSVLARPLLDKGPRQTDPSEITAVNDIGDALFEALGDAVGNRVLDAVAARRP